VDPPTGDRGNDGLETAPLVGDAIDLALALGLGAAFVAWPGLNLLDAAGAAIPRLGDVLPMLVIGFYVAGIIRARRHYR